MARVAVSLSVGSTTPGRERFDNVGHSPDPVPTVVASTYTTDKAAFEAALAVLVADGASPTQAHVTTCNNAYTTFKAELGGNPAAQDIVLSVDLAKITSVSQINFAVQTLLNILRGNKALSQ